MMSVCAIRFGFSKNRGSSSSASLTSAPKLASSGLIGRVASRSSPLPLPFRFAWGIPY